MKIRRYIAADMRQAMRQVREAQGADAVILSSRRCSEGVEIIAALDYDEAQLRAAAQDAVPDSASAPAQAPAAAGVAAQTAQHIASFTSTITELLRGNDAPPRQGAAAALPRATTPIAPPAAVESAPAIAAVQHELGELRQMLEAQLASLAWNDFSRRQPLRKQVLAELHRMGIEPDVAARLLAELPETLSSDQTRYLPLGLLSRRLPVSSDDLLGTPGALALVGPTGVGKTTTLAKLAAQQVAAHGAHGVALVSADAHRVGAGDQLFHYGRMLRVPVYAAADAADLRDILDRLRGTPCVLIDTPGFGYRDARIQQLLAVLGEGAAAPRSVLVLAANAQAVVLDSVIRAYAALTPQGCILTKLDETPQPAAAYSVLMRHALPLHYVTDGQRVPEDIQRADAHRLACRAARVRTGEAPALSGEISESILAERFGRIALGQT